MIKYKSPKSILHHIAGEGVVLGFDDNDKCYFLKFRCTDRQLEKLKAKYNPDYILHGYSREILWSK
jgi:hypothetical protein